MKVKLQKSKRRTTRNEPGSRITVKVTRFSEINHIAKCTVFVIYLSLTRGEMYSEDGKRKVIYLPKRLLV
jgi:hypothetical protein